MTKSEIVKAIFNYLCTRLRPLLKKYLEKWLPVLLLTFFCTPALAQYHVGAGGGEVGPIEVDLSGSTIAVRCDDSGHTYSGYTYRNQRLFLTFRATTQAQERTYSLYITGGPELIQLTVTQSGLYPTLTGGTIATASQQVPARNTPPVIEASAATGGNGTYRYQWQQKTPAATVWTDIAGANSQNLALSVLTQTLSFRRLVSCTLSGQTIQHPTTNTVTFTLVPYRESIPASGKRVETNILRHGAETVDFTCQPIAHPEMRLEYEGEYVLLNIGPSWNTATMDYTVTVTNRTTGQSETMNLSQPARSASLTVTPSLVTYQGTAQAATNMTYLFNAPAYNWTRRYVDQTTGTTVRTSSPHYSFTNMTHSAYISLEIVHGSYPTFKTAEQLVEVKLSGGAITASAYEVIQGQPVTFSNSSAAGGSWGNYQYAWYVSADNRNWTKIAHNSTSYSYGAVHSTIYVKRSVVSQGRSEEAFSNTITVTAVPLLQPGTFEPPVINITSGSSPGTLTPSAASGGKTGIAYTYQWLQSATGAAGSFTPITGAGSSSYNPGTLGQTTYYQRRVSSATQTAVSNTLKVNVTPRTESVSGNGGYIRLEVDGIDPEPVAQRLSCQPQNPEITATQTGNLIQINFPQNWKPQPVVHTLTLRNNGNIYTAYVTHEIQPVVFTASPTGPLTYPTSFVLQTNAGATQYRWQYRNPHTTTLWTDLSSTTTPSLSVSGLTTDRNYRVRLIKGADELVSDEYAMKVLLGGGRIEAEAPYVLNGSDVVINDALSDIGGDGSHSYRWKMRYIEADGTPQSWQDLSDTGKTLQVAALEQEAEFVRLSVDKSGQTAESNTVSVGVYETELSEVLIGYDQVIFSGTQPHRLALIEPVTGGPGDDIYQWLHKTAEMSEFSVVKTGGTSFQPDTLVQTTQYRLRIYSKGLTRESNVVTIVASNEDYIFPWEGGQFSYPVEGPDYTENAILTPEECSWSWDRDENEIILHIVPYSDFNNDRVFTVKLISPKIREETWKIYQTKRPRSLVVYNQRIDAGEFVLIRGIAATDERPQHATLYRKLDDETYQMVESTNSRILSIGVEHTAFFTVRKSVLRQDYKVVMQFSRNPQLEAEGSVDVRLDGGTIYDLIYTRPGQPYTIRSLAPATGGWGGEYAYSWEQKTGTDNTSSGWEEIPDATGAELNVTGTGVTRQYRRMTTSLRNEQKAYSNVCRIYAEGDYPPERNEPRNSIRRNVPLAPVATVSPAASQTLSDITYHDGLGRPVQEVMVGYTTSGNDLTRYVQYDAHGRPDSKNYLAFADSIENGAYKTGAPSRQYDYYRQQHGTDNGQWAFVEREYEISALDRPLKQYNSGSIFRTKDKYVAMSYRFNRTDDQVWHLTVTDDGKLSVTGYFADGKLQKTESTDEDGRLQAVFTDKLGRTLLERTVADGTSLDVYYVYDRKGNLAWVLSPEGSRRLAAGQTCTADDAAGTYATVYGYDAFDRVSSRRIPGKEVEYYAYDAGDRPVLYQDGNLRADGRALMTVYDGLGRITTEGFVPVTATTAAGLQAVYDGGTITAPAVVVSEYAWDTYPAWSEAFTPALDVATAAVWDNRTTGLKTAERLRILDEDDSGQSLTRTFHYDAKSRLVQTRETEAGRTSAYSIAYNWTGQPLSTLEEHVLDGRNSIDRLRTDNTYDSRSRLITQTTRLASYDPVTVYYRYDDRGRLVRKDFDGAGASEHLAYNLQDWLTEKTFYYNDTLAMKLNLNYYSPQTTGAVARYGGDVTERITDARSWSNYNLFTTYHYDGFGRLTHNRFLMGLPGTSTPTLQRRFTERGITYDGNGNILTLVRYDDEARAGSNYLADSLRYTYQGNRLTALTDLSGNDLFARSTSYGYDAGGNLVKDTAEGLEMTYNFLNLPSKVTRNGQTAALYRYAADGTKLGVSGAGDEGLIYAGSLVYKPWTQFPLIESAAFAEGRFYNVDNKYVQPLFFFKDHLGTVDSEWQMTDSPTNLFVSLNLYYPFGHRASAGRKSTLNDRYQFNGKERQTVGEMNYIDFGARTYDPIIGRFTKIDRFADKYAALSGYSYVANNPIRNIDINGDSIWIENNGANFLFMNGNLFNQDGSQYGGKLKGFLKQAVNALNTIGSAQSGKEMLTELQKSSNNFTISSGPESKFTAKLPQKAYYDQLKTSNHPAYQLQSEQLVGGSGGKIEWNTSGVPINTSIGLQTMGIIDLAHELFHALDANRGLLNKQKQEGIERSEWQAVFRENVLRSELGAPLRTHYRSTYDEYGNKIGYPPFMLTPDGKPYKPSWY